MKARIPLLMLLLPLLPAPVSATHSLSWTGNINLGGEWVWKSGELYSADPGEVAASSQGWNKMQVPSNWFLQGHDLSGPVWMRKTFMLTTEPSYATAQLVFEGVDYSADVWLNGAYLGFHEGYFAPFRFSVSKTLRYGRENVLLVRVNSPNEDFGRVWSLHKRIIKGVLNHHDTRPGGAWSQRGQEENTGGIWAPVYLRITNHAFISDLRVATSPSSGKAESNDGYDWNADSTLNVDYPGQKDCAATLEVTFEPGNFSPSAPSGGSARQSVVLHPGRNTVSIHAIASHVQRWWSWDQGAQPLYRVTVRILENLIVLDQVQDNVGFRTVKVSPDTQDWQINGRRVFLRGTNYISTQWLSEMTPERYAFDIALARRANINAIRVHAHVEAQEFYRACDQNGILVWQDFPLQWGYTEEPSFESVAVKQALDMVSMLFNHASIFAWSMHNEPPWDAPWMQYKYKGYDSQQNKRLDEKLYDAVRDADPGRVTHLASETSEHPWLGWYSGTWKDYGKPTQQALITEYGAQALPDLPSLKRIVGEENLWPDSDAKWAEWEFHNFQRHETFELAHVSQGTNPNELIANTQEYQARLIQFAAESYRRQRFNPVAAIFQFMFVEDWPSMNWGVLDYWRNKKPGYDALALAYQPVLPSIAWDGLVWTAGSDFSLDLWAINDLPTSYSQCRYVGELARSGAVLQRVDLRIDLQPDEGKKIASLAKKKIDAGSYSITTRLEDTQGQVLGHDSFAFQVQADEQTSHKRK